MSANQILEMIESVDPSDRKAMDQIDLDFWKWYADLPITNCYDDYEGACGFSFETDIDYWELDGYSLLPSSQPHHRVSRSRDALKLVRPEGWCFDIEEEDVGKFICWPYCWEKYSDLERTPYFPSEELAELHAIIQSIEFERGNKLTR